MHLISIRMGQGNTADAVVRIKRDVINFSMSFEYTKFILGF